MSVPIQWRKPFFSFLFPSQARVEDLDVEVLTRDSQCPTACNPILAYRGARYGGRFELRDFPVGYPCPCNHIRTEFLGVQFRARHDEPANRLDRPLGLISGLLELPDGKATLRLLVGSEVTQVCTVQTNPGHSERRLVAKQLGSQDLISLSLGGSRAQGQPRVGRVRADRQDRQGRTIRVTYLCSCGQSLGRRGGHESLIRCLFASCVGSRAVRQ